MHAVIAGTVDSTRRSLEYALSCWDAQALVPVKSADDLTRVMGQLEDASILVVDLASDSMLDIAWVIGAASVFGIPVVGLSVAPPIHSPTLLWSLATVKSTVVDVQITVNALLQSMKRGVDDYAQVVATLHAQYRETL